VAELDALRRRIIAPLEELRRTPEAPGGTLAAALYGFLERIELPRQLTDRSEALRQRGRLQQAEEYRQLWDILCNALEQCAQLMGEAPMSMAEFGELFRLVLGQYDVGTIPVALDRLSVGELQRMTHKEAKVLFLLGVDDTRFPMVTEQPGLLTQEDRKVLNALGCELDSGPEVLLEREQATACDGVCMPSRKLYLSWARQGSGGEECRPANLIEAARRLFPALRVEEPDPALRYNAPLTALESAAREGREDVLEVLAEEEAWKDRVAGLRAARGQRRGRLSREAAAELYGERIRMSASKLDTLRSCHFAYFLNYGLRAKARRKAELDPPQVGTFVHYVLEHLLRQAGERGGVKQLTDEAVKELVQGAVERYLREELGDLEKQPPRFQYLFRRLRRSVELIALNVVEELRSSEFEPLSFELGFGDGKTLPAVELEESGVRLALAGYVDRVDGWVHNDRLYLRVVDYKTGKKSFSLTDVWHGLELQMLLYLFTLSDAGQELYGRQVRPAGVLYLPARDLILSGSRTMTEEQIRTAADKELCRSGMLLDEQEVLEAMEHLEGKKGRFLHLKRNKDNVLVGDVLATAEQWGKMRRHVEGVLRAIARELSQGRVDADPWRRGGGQSFCDWCDYRRCCHFEEGQGDCYRYLYTVKEKEFWERAGE
jgi:ATP-dependent helicase/nuclease subunit B